MRKLHQLITACALGAFRARVPCVGFGPGTLAQQLGFKRGSTTAESGWGRQCRLEFSEDL